MRLCVIKLHSYCVVTFSLQETEQFCFCNSRTANSTRDDDRDEVSSTVSYLSDISGLSELSGQEWKPMTGRCLCTWQILLL
jgi:hypothetical protein